MGRKVSRISSLVLIALMAAAVLIRPYDIEARRSLAHQVTIRRDTFGIPHILGETEAAAAFGMGYAQAEDHAVEIATRFVTARGEQAKHLGTGAESDFRMKRYGNYEVAKKSFPELTPLFQSLLNAYAAGFNLYVEKHRDSLPRWVPVFDGVDVLAQGRAEVMRFAFDEGMIRAVQNKYPASVAKSERLDPKIKSRTSQAGAETDPVDLAGSNMWALSGSKTTSGKTILMGNPHQPWAALYWEAHVTVPGRINFYGSTFVGRPILTSGFNEYLGWSHTVNYPDLADVVALSLDSKNRDRYLFNGKPMPLTRKEAVVEIREPDGRLREERRTYTYSHLGPIVHQTSDKVFALKSAIQDAFRYYEEWYAMSKSRSLQEFVSHLKTNQIPMFNIAYADVEGNIGYWWNGMVPRRLDDGSDYRVDVSGENTKHVWNSLHRLEELPQLINPAGGYVQNCNDPPWWTSLRNAMDPKKYPSYIEPGRRLGLRTQMSLEMIESRQRFSLEDVKRLKYHTKMLIADRVKPDLILAIKALANPSEDLKRGLAVIESWDNHVARESRGAVLFKKFWDNYSTDTKTPYAVAWDPREPATTPRGLGDLALAVRHFEEAVKWTRQTYGSESIAWGEVHRLRLGDVDLPMGGESGLYGLFRVVTYAPARDGKLVVGTVEKGRPMQGGGDGWIFVVEFSRPLTAYSVLAYGETSNPASKHSTDQAALFANQEYKKVRFTEAEIKSNLERSYHPGD
jgi:acyl-homoserine-lactone acylase